MTKYTNRVQETLKQYVLDCFIMRYNTQETIDYIQRMYGKKISEAMICHYRTRLREDSKEALSFLTKDSFAYQYEFMQRIEEIRKLQRKQYDLLDTTISDFVKFNCLKELHALSISLTNLYHDLPMVTMNRPNRINDELSTKIQIPAGEAEPSTSPE